MRHILFFLLGIGSASVPAISEPIPPHVGELTFTDYVSYYRTAGNFANAGTSSTDLPLGGYLSYLSDTLSVNYDAFSEWRFNANLSYGMTTASNSNTTSTGQGLTEGGLGAQYWVRFKRWALVPTAQVAFPFYRNSFTQSDAMIGNGAIWAEGGAWGFLYYHPVTIYGYAGYRYQDSGLAGWLTADVGASYRFDVARARAGIRGQTTVNNDRDTNNPLLRNVMLANVDNSSMKFNSVNPTEFEAYGEFDWLFTRKWEAGAGFAQSFYGNNAAFGWTVMGMVRFRLPTGAAKNSPPPGNPPEFTEPPPISEPIFQPAGVPDEVVNPRPKARVKKSRRGGGNIDQMIQDTEKSLQK